VIRGDVAIMFCFFFVRNAAKVDLLGKVVDAPL